MKAVCRIYPSHQSLRVQLVMQYTKGYIQKTVHHRMICYMRVSRIYGIIAIGDAIDIGDQYIHALLRMMMIHRVSNKNIKMG